MRKWKKFQFVPSSLSLSLALLIDRPLPLEVSRSCSRQRHHKRRRKYGGMSTLDIGWLDTLCDSGFVDQFKLVVFIQCITLVIVKDKAYSSLWNTCNPYLLYQNYTFGHFYNSCCAAPRVVLDLCIIRQHLPRMGFPICSTESDFLIRVKFNSSCLNLTQIFFSKSNFWIRKPDSSQNNLDSLEYRDSSVNICRSQIWRRKGRRDFPRPTLNGTADTVWKWQGRFGKRCSEYSWTLT